MLDKLRREIDCCDATIMETLCRRFTYSACVAGCKKEQGMTVYHPERERAILGRITEITENPAHVLAMQELYEHVFQLSRRIQFQQLFPFNVVLIGFMGSGKSSVGRYLARMIGYTCYDVDEIVEQRVGQSIKKIFNSQGEAYFRLQEREAIASLNAVENAIIACGGGVILDDANINCLKKQGKMVWLQAEADTVLDRLKNQIDRPLLKNKKLEDIIEMIQKREQYYAAAADYEVATDGKSISEIGQELFSRLTISKN